MVQLVTFFTWDLTILLLCSRDDEEQGNLHNSHWKYSSIPKVRYSCTLNTCVHICSDANGLTRFIKGLESVWPEFARAKSAKLIRDLLNCFNGIALPEAIPAQISLTKDLIQWCVEDKRSFLKQALESRLGNLYLRSRQFTEALSLINDLLRELKRMDDKLTLVQIHLLECKVYFELKNMAKAKAALTAARSAANSVYTPPLIQASLDLQSGILHAEDNDFKTAFSYFIEALDAFSASKDPLGATTLKYMILCKIMIGAADDIDTLVGGKLGQNYSLGKEVEAMKAVGEAYKARSLKQFEAALQTYPTELTADIIVQTHFNSLYDSLLQQNIIRIIEPYSRVQISHIANSIGLDVGLIERKLSQMILDKALSGILDQNEGCLIIIEETPCDDLYKVSMDLFKNLDKVVDSLYTKATNL